MDDEFLYEIFEIIRDSENLRSEDLFNLINSNVGNQLIYYNFVILMKKLKDANYIKCKHSFTRQIERFDDATITDAGMEYLYQHNNRDL